MDGYLSMRDRAPTILRGVPFFSGREAEISVFREVANDLSRAYTANATIVVEGPPGAGKSALMCQFMEEMRSLPPVGVREWLPVLISASDSESPTDIADAIDRAIVSRLSEELLASKSVEPILLDRLSEYWGKLNLVQAMDKAKEFFDRGGSALGFSLGTSHKGPPKSIAQAATRRPSWQSWQIVLLIDEAQVIKPGVTNAGYGTLSMLHQGLSQAPLSFCAFGLPGTQQALSEVGISRLADSRCIRLGGISDTAAQQMIERCFKRFGVVSGEQWLKAILDRASNWPQHLAVYLNAAIRQIRNTGNDSMDARIAGLDKAMREGDRSRANYYRQRIARLNQYNIEFGELAMELAKLIQETNLQIHTSDLMKAIRAFYPKMTSADITQFIQESEHSGFLAPTNDDKYAYCVPIPSFARYLLDAGSA